jgi:hypothetical protein
MLFVTVALSALATLAIAAPANQCNTGPVQCCNTVEESNNMSSHTSKLCGLANVDVKNLTGKIGTNCTPVAALALAGNKWSVQLLF